MSMGAKRPPAGIVGVKGMSPKVRRIGAGLMFLTTLVAWPVSMLTFAKNEPPSILSLSWLALTLTCLDIWATTDVREKSED
jgi:hypothetical protein